MLGTVVYCPHFIVHRNPFLGLFYLNSVQRLLLLGLLPLLFG